eukprot:4770450-Pleurochrysis_carterae.AAC.2
MAPHRAASSPISRRNGPLSSASFRTRHAARVAHPLETSRASLLARLLKTAQKRVSYTSLVSLQSGKRLLCNGTYQILQQDAKAPKLRLSWSWEGQLACLSLTWKVKCNSLAKAVAELECNKFKN